MQANRHQYENELRVPHPFYGASSVQVMFVFLPFGQIVFLKTALSSRERPTLARNRLASVKLALLRIAQVKSA
jgi:hypothetical protein